MESSDELEQLSTYSSATEEENQQDVINMSFESFDECKRICFGIWYTNLNEPNWKLSTCTCPHFFKKHTCKNIIGISARLNLVKIPIETKNVPLGEKRKRIDDESMMNRNHLLLVTHKSLQSLSQLLKKDQQII
ncbi:hypothetical protein BpHYR1_047206 [Brachionus plicatilis]|uniref:SWIM-type domain-containing protein n=1 Tax=Brachionus plicatilis TaxID=10195 RepID=A0A3M7QFB4_BRAPC|nr:hypothetical protein BpHYR1_047206 [Brachionus plicatilis]